MKVEKIFKREDGSKVKLCVELSISPYSQDPIRYNISVWKCAPNKRKYYCAVNTDNYQYRSLSMPDRANNRMIESFKFITPDELLAACNECIDLCRPTKTNIFF